MISATRTLCLLLRTNSSKETPVYLTKFDVDMSTSQPEIIRRKFFNLIRNNNDKLFIIEEEGSGCVMSVSRKFLGDLFISQSEIETVIRCFLGLVIILVSFHVLLEFFIIESSNILDNHDHVSRVVRTEESFFELLVFQNNRFAEVVDRMSLKKLSSFF